MPHDGMLVLADLVAPGQSVAMGNESAGEALQRLETSMRNAASHVSHASPPQEVPPRSSASAHGGSRWSQPRDRPSWPTRFLTEGPPPLYAQTSRPWSPRTNQKQARNATWISQKRRRHEARVLAGDVGVRSGVAAVSVTELEWRIPDDQR